MTTIDILNVGSNDYIIISYDIKKVLFGGASEAKLKIKKVDASNIPLGTFVKIYLYCPNGDKDNGYLAFSGYVRSKKNVGSITEVLISDEKYVFYHRFKRKVVRPSDTVTQRDPMDIADVVEYIVSLVPDVSYTREDTGITIDTFIINEYLGKALDRLAKAIGYIWFVKDNVLYFKQADYLDSGVTLTNVDGLFEKWDFKPEMLCNEVHLFGANKDMSVSDVFAGDGSTTEFDLTYPPYTNIRVYAYYDPYLGRELPPTEYEVQHTDKKIIFNTAPPTISSGVITGYEAWQYKREITIDFGLTDTNTLTNPVVIVKFYSGNVDLENMRGDMKDVRFLYKSDLSPIKFVYLGTLKDGTKAFALKLEGTYTSSDSTEEIIMLYGNPDSYSFPYTYSDVFSVHEAFTSEYDLTTTGWTVSILSYDCTDCGSCDVSSNDYIHTAYAKSFNGYAELYVRHNGLTGNGIAWIVEVYAETPSRSGVKWVYFKDDPLNATISENDTLSFTATAIKSGPCGYDLIDSTKLYHGLYYFTDYSSISTPTITISQRMPNKNFNVEVAYTIKAPIYSFAEDVDSKNAHNGFVYSKVINASWITTQEDADTLALKYLEFYATEPKSFKFHSIDKYILSLGLDIGKLVSVSDSYHNVSESGLIIYSVQYNDGVAYVEGGTKTITPDIFNWGSNIDERIRQLEIQGDENFFIL